jgi:hypothetical protein
MADGWAVRTVATMAGLRAVKMAEQLVRVD